MPLSLATLMIVKASTLASPGFLNIVWLSEWITKSVGPDGRALWIE